MHINSRTEQLIGLQALQMLQASSVAIFGVGGVGGYVAEALARAGVGSLTLIDFDTVNLSNINRQIIALHSTVGMPKTEAMKARINDINPSIQVTAITERYPCNLSLEGFSYVVDAIDMVSSKLTLIEEATRLNVPIISAMGAGNKLTTQFIITDIYQTHTCPLAKIMRSELKKRSVTALKVCYSPEPPIVKERTPASISFAPSCMGLIIASEVIKDIINYKG